MKKRLEKRLRKSIMGFNSNKKAQVTIFIILGIIIVVAGVLVYMFYPELQASFGLEEVSPYGFMQSCLEDEMNVLVQEISIHGGSIEPEFPYTYNGEEMEYLCYTNEYYKECLVQQPFLVSHIESELTTGMNDIQNDCFDRLKESFEERGYEVILRKGDFKVNLLPKRISFDSNTTLSLKKDETKNYESFSIGFNNNLYELASIANNIVLWETTYGEAEITVYMDYYHDLKVEKFTQSEGTKVYIITDKNTGNKFQFASRSLAWPPGYWDGEV